jgi:hypothetical protein
MTTWFLEIMGNYYGIDWFAMLMTFFSLYYLGKKMKRGFVFGGLANVSWLAFGVMAGSLANPIANIIFITLNVRGFMSWKEMQE